MYDDFGTFLAYQGLCLLGGCLRNDDDNWHGQVASCVGHCNARIPAGRGNEPPRAASDVLLAGPADAPNLEGTRRLHGFELHSDCPARGDAQRTRLKEGGFNVQWLDPGPSDLEKKYERPAYAATEAPHRTASPFASSGVSRNNSQPIMRELRTPEIKIQQIEEVAGVAVKDNTTLDELLKAKKSEQAQSRSLADLWELKNKRGNKDMWVYYIFESRILKENGSIDWINKKYGLDATDKNDLKPAAKRAWNNFLTHIKQTKL